MQQSMEARLKEIAERHGEVENLMSQPETASDPNAIRKLGREYSQLQHVVELWNQMTSAQTNLEGVQEMIAEEDDAEVVEMANMEATELKEKLDAAPEEHQVRLDYAVALFGAGCNEQAIEELIEIIRRDRAWNEEAARKQLLKMFDALGPTHELTANGRRHLSSVLFS